MIFDGFYEGNRMGMLLVRVQGYLLKVLIYWIKLEILLIPLCALWMPPAISRKEAHFQSYRFGYH